MTALSSTDLAALEKLCEATIDKTRVLQRYAKSATVTSYAEKGAVLSEELNTLGNTLNRFRNAFPSLAATIRADKTRIGKLERDFDRLDALCENLGNDCDRYIAQRDAALAEVQQLKADLTNQTWLRERSSHELSVTRRNWRNDLKTIDQLSASGNAWRKRIGEMEAEVERLKREADGEYVQAAIRVMRANPGFDARDYAQDGITADDFESFFTEDMNEAWRLVEKAQTRVAELEAARPSAPAPDRGVPGQDGFTEDEFVELRNALLNAGSETHLKAIFSNNLNVILAALGRRATHPAPPEWRDAIEAAAEVAEDEARIAKELGSSCSGFGSSNRIAAAIRSLPPPSTSASPWRDIASAPKDGTQFLAQMSEGIRVLCWETGSIMGDFWFAPAGDCGGGQAYRKDPLAWMPLPAPPSTPATEGEDGR